MAMKTRTRAASAEGGPKQADPVAEWLEQGRLLRQNLLDERDRLQARLATIDAALMRLSAAEAQVDVRPSSATQASMVPDLSGATHPEAIIAAVRAHMPKGATLGDIRDFVERGGKKLDGKHIPSYLYKLREARILASRGKKGSMRYLLGPDAPATTGAAVDADQEAPV